MNGMTGDELKAAAIRLFGEARWQSDLAEKLGLNRTTVWRMTTKEIVPSPVAAAVRCWLENGLPK